MTMIGSMKKRGDFDRLQMKEIKGKRKKKEREKETQISNVDAFLDRLVEYPTFSSQVLVQYESRAHSEKRRKCRMRVLVVLIVIAACITAAHVHGTTTRDVKASAECVSCIGTAAVLGQIAKLTPTESTILWFAKMMCTLFAKEPYAVCDGIAEQFRGEFFYVFRKLANEPTKICGALITGCGDPNDPLGEGWQISLPPKQKERSKFTRKEKKRTIRTKTSKGLLRVLQLADIHIDYKYAPGSEAECGEPVCCRLPKEDDNELVGNIMSAGYWGTIGKCDIPYRTLEHLLDHLNKTEKIDYIMMSGDLINHVDWKYTWEGHVEVLRNLSSLFKQYFPATPTYWALGNHEGVPVNSFATHQVEARFWPTKLYKELTRMNDPWVKEEGPSSSNFRGSWSTKALPGLRIISINTGFCINTNFFLYLNQSDPDGTMSWFVDELYKAEQAGEAVHVLAHIPPGYDDCLEGWSRNYYKVLQRFASTIKAQYFGHVHWDYFTLFYEDMANVSSPAVGVSYVSPSLTTFDYLNPAYRIYTIDADNDYAVVDFDNYWADLKETNEDIPPQWKPLYSAKAEFSLPDLSPASWAQLAERILDSPQLQERFFELSFRTPSPHCDHNCRQSLLCLLRSGHHNDTLYCPRDMLQSNRVYLA